MNERVVSLRFNGVDVTKYASQVEFNPGDLVAGGMVIGESRTIVCYAQITRTESGYHIGIQERLEGQGR